MNDSLKIHHQHAAVRLLYCWGLGGLVLWIKV